MDNISRNGLKKLRKELIKLLPEKEKETIDRITEGLIEFNEAVMFEYPENRRSYVRSEVSSSGYGAFGERENDYWYYVITTDGKKQTYYQGASLVAKSKEDYILGTLILDVPKLITKLKGAKLELVDDYEKSFE